MSQPQLTSFFTQAKRGTRNAKSVKNENTNVDIQSKRITRSKRIAETVSGNDDYESSKSLLLNSGEKKTALPNQNTIRKLETKSEENVLGEESPSVPLIQDSLIRSTRNRRKLDETTSSGGSRNSQRSMLPPQLMRRQYFTPSIFDVKAE